jgi:DNA repair protein RecO (recombination protein O)
MKVQIVTKAVVLSRRNFAEADRILTVITPEHGKMSLIAKGVRRPKSKLAGGIELFAVNDLTILPSRNQLQTMISSRMATNFGNIIKDIQKTMLGYELLKRLNRYMEDEAGPEYFKMLESTLTGLNDEDLKIGHVELWFTVQLLKITGHSPNLATDTEGNKLLVDESYLFDFEATAFRQQYAGPYSAKHIKVLRVAYASDSPLIFKQLKDSSLYLDEMLSLAKNVLQQHISN